jgi:ABC-type transport system involved in multi-copper enzyme maturation permease subunit
VRYVGTVLSKELKEVSKRKRTFFLRAALPLITMFFLIPTLISLLYQDNTQTAWTGRISFMTIAYIMLVFGFLITPAYCAPLIACEREQQTLEVMLSTPIRHYEIVLGKIASRVLLLFLIALSVLPAMFVAFMFGGISIWDIGMTYLIVICNILICAGVSIVASSLATKSVTAISHTYGFIILMGIILSVVVNLLFFFMPRPFTFLRFLFLNMNPFMMMSFLIDSGILMSRSGIFTGMAADAGFFVFCVFLSSTILRRNAYREPRKSSLKHFFLVSSRAKSVKERTSYVKIGRVFTNPVYWRECMESAFSRGSTRMRSTFIAFAVLFAIYIITLMTVPKIWLNVFGSGYRELFHAPFLFGEFAMILLSAISLSSNSFSKERSKKTLEALVLTPLEDQTLWLGKFLGVCRRCLIPYMLALTHLALCVFHGIYPHVALYMTMLTTAVLFLFFAVMGTGFSIRCQKKTSAMTLTLLVASVPFIWIPTISAMFSSPVYYSKSSAEYLFSLSPWIWLVYPFNMRAVSEHSEFGVGYFSFIAIYIAFSAIFAAVFSRTVREKMKME